LIYRLRPGVRARKESFGLLFYDSRDAKLTFVRSGSLLSIERTPPGSETLKVSGAEQTDLTKAGKFLSKLLEKGLIVDDRDDG
jgi:putative mycofactocin binding protein MftB